MSSESSTGHKKESAKFLFYQFILVEEHYCGAMDSICRFCGALHFAAERSSDGLFTQCCQKGKVILPEDEFGNVLHYPPFLQSLLSNPADPNYRNFRENIRSYNNSVSFASVGAKIVKLHGRGPYCFKVNRSHSATKHTRRKCRLFAINY